MYNVKTISMFHHVQNYMMSENAIPKNDGFDLISIPSLFDGI